MDVECEIGRSNLFIKPVVEGSVEPDSLLPEGGDLIGRDHDREREADREPRVFAARPAISDPGFEPVLAELSVDLDDDRRRVTLAEKRRSVRKPELDFLNADREPSILEVIARDLSVVEELVRNSLELTRHRLSLAR